MNKKINIALAIVMIILIAGALGIFVYFENRDQSMNESICIQQGGLWGQHENSWDDGRFDMFFACTCPQEKSDETRVIPEGSPSNCK
ncbi:MAG: hypothetical protein V1892_02850 [bacterium]